jgi:hypothetical protein
MHFALYTFNALHIHINTNNKVGTYEYKNIILISQVEKRCTHNLLFNKVIFTFKLVSGSKLLKYLCIVSKS